MRKILMLMLMLMLLPAAVAEEVQFAPEMLALRKANRAMAEKYGHTHETLGLFEVSFIQGGERYLIVYTSSGCIPEVLTGEYYALVNGEDVHLLWTHDGVDASLWQSGELTSPAWGVKQLTVYLDEHPFTRADFCEPYETEALAAQMAAIGGPYPFDEVRCDNRDAAEAACKLACSALQAMYGLSDEEAARLHWFSDMTKLIHYSGHSEWMIALQDDVPDKLDPIEYCVILNADTGEILRITHSSGGVG